mmetsp:Transcript_39290/g.76884  ORF Transcript_39290/g.76884 Transcript_39290/m.76884 type:complete len:472 (-) Transcript_39290:36-1451(-)
MCSQAAKKRNFQKHSRLLGGAGVGAAVDEAVGLKPPRVGLDEALRKRNVEASLNIHRHKVLLVERLGRRAAESDDVAPVEFHANLTADVPLGVVERVLEKLHLGREPVAVVAKLAILEGQTVADAKHLPVHGQRLDVEMASAKDGASRSLINATRLDTHIPVLHDIDTADGMGTSKLVEKLEHGSRRSSSLPIAQVDNLDRVSLLIEDLDLIGGLLGLLERHSVPVARIGSCGGRILQNSRLKRDVEHVVVHAVGRPVASLHSDGNATLLGKSNQIVASLKLVVELGDPPGDDALEVGEAISAKLKPNLIVALASRAVREVRAVFLHGNVDLGPGDAGASKRRSEQVSALVNGVAADDRKDVVLDKVLLKVQHIRLDSARRERLRLDAREVLIVHPTALSEVGGEGDDLVALVRQPSELRRGIEASRVGKHKLLPLAIKLRRSHRARASRRVASGHGIGTPQHGLREHSSR